MTGFAEIHRRCEVALGVLASLFQIFKNLWRKILRRSCSDLRHIMELKGRPKVDQLDTFDVILVLVEFYQNVIRFDVRMHNTESG